jgi:hypothetical protein
MYELALKRGGKSEQSKREEIAILRRDKYSGA